MSGYEFEDEAPLELLESNSKDPEPKTIKGSASVETAIMKKIHATEMGKRIKENPPALKLHAKLVHKKYETKDYIKVHCNLCEHDYQHAKKEPDGTFTPYALCQHIVFKGVFVE